MSEAFKEILRDLAKMSDQEAYDLAVFAAGYAASRAERLGRRDVEQIIAAFILKMHDAVGTPAPPSGKQPS